MIDLNVILYQVKTRWKPLEERASLSSLLPTTVTVCRILNHLWILLIIYLLDPDIDVRYEKMVIH